VIELFHRDLGGQGNPPLVLLHGLLGSSRNWMAAGRDLADHFHALALDLRNHGSSPHAGEHHYQAMVEDVLGWLDRAGLASVYLLGHSMGGKTAMRLACQHPERVKALVVVDISPRAKEPNHVAEFRALNALPLEKISSRAEADRMLAEEVSSWGMRQFLLTNLVRQPDGSFGWQANLAGLTRNLAETGKSPVREDERFTGPALWIVGGKSDFVRPEDHSLILKHFPRAQIEIFPESGHNPHADDRARFVETLRKFLAE
jgi:esterase